MEVTNVAVSLGIKASLGNYNMANINYSVSATPGDGEDPEQVKQELEEIVDAWVSGKLKEIKARNGQ